MAPSTYDPERSEYDTCREDTQDTAEQHTLLGVSRIYVATLIDAYCGDAARLMFGQCYVPPDGACGSGIAYISRQALEKALWPFRTEYARLKQERFALLRRLRFNIAAPYFVLYDSERFLYAFHPGLAPHPT